MMEKLRTRDGSMSGFRLQAPRFGPECKPMPSIVPWLACCPKPAADRRESASIERKVGLRVSRTDVLGARTDQTVVGVLLEHMSGPARHTADREHRREQIDRNAERVVGRRRVEIDVGVQLLLRLDHLFDL